MKIGNTLHKSMRKIILEPLPSHLTIRNQFDGFDTTKKIRASLLFHLLVYGYVFYGLSEGMLITNYNSYMDQTEEQRPLTPFRFARREWI